MNRITDFLKELTFLGRREGTTKEFFWKGASFGVLLLTFALVLINSFHATYGMARIWIVLIALLMAILSFVVFAILSQLVIRSLRLYPVYFVGTIGGVIGVMMVLKNIRFGIPTDFFYYGGGLALVACIFVFGAASVLVSGKWGSFQKWRRFGVLLGLIFGVCYLGYAIHWLKSEGPEVKKEAFEQISLSPEFRLDQPDPSEKGTYQVRHFSYGSGINNKRPEFGTEATYISAMVNGQYILPQWKNKQAEKRSGYWGFDVDQWPINGLVWMPEGEGPFPMVLIVHGNHNMEDYSDPGYAYLGELLASRGYLTISVDENYINGSWAGDFRGKELPARAWLLLKHLEQWRTWNGDPTHELSGKADLDRVSLIGHSRGGEAVPIAAAFNTLSHFPDDAREVFDFKFGIRSVIAIAPTDYRYDRRVQLQNVDYLGLQGSFDSDEESFFGLRQWQRTTFSDSSFHTKAGVYIQGANHGQFNSIWGRHDSGFPGKLFLNTKPMISGEDQRKYAAILISAFLELSLKDQLAYAALFRDLRVADHWFPEGVTALSVYEDTRTTYWADFEEDIELTTIGMGRSQVEGFEVWAEDYLQYRGGRHQENHALVLGWKQDSTATEASYNMQFDRNLSMASGDWLTISVGAGDPALLGKVKDDQLVNEVELVLHDRSGSETSAVLTEFKKIFPRHLVRFMKTRSLNASRYQNEWEPFLETMFVPVSAFDTTGFDLANLSGLSIRVQTDHPGVVLVDRIGVRRGE